MLLNPDITVLLSVYNGEKYLSEAIESILNQTFKNFEFLIVNDGSTDSSLDIIKKYMQIDPRIVLISRQNKGLIASLNEGIEAAKGKYIARMDADDISMPTRLEVQYSFMEKNDDVVVCGSWVEIFNKKGSRPYLHKYLINSIDIKTQSLFTCPFAHPSVILRKDILLNNYIRYNNRFLHAEDYQLWVELSKYGSFANIPQILVRYRYLDDSVTRVADRDLERRSKILCSIYNQAAKNVGLELTDNDTLLYYKVSNNERLSHFDVIPVDFEEFIKKVLIRVKGINTINYKFIEIFLMKRYSRLVLSKFLYKRININFFVKGLFFGFVNKTFRNFNNVRINQIQ